MKILNGRFVGGTLIVALGLLGLITGLFSLLPPTNNVVVGVVLAVVGAGLMIFGYKYAKDAPPPAAKTSVETLRQAGMLDKDRKK